MERREAVRLLGAIAAVPFLPRTAESATELAERIHESIQAGARFRTLNAEQQVLVTHLADAILPRTDTPGALDVRVPEFIDHVVTDWAGAAERQALLDGLAAIDARARAFGAASFVALNDAQQADMLRALDEQRMARDGAGHAFGLVKSLAVYGYFTSETVQREVLRTQMFFTAFEACAPA
jgi:hypothetical protein